MIPPAIKPGISVHTICIDGSSRFNAKIREQRDLSTLIGICKGIPVDKIVPELEIPVLDGWLKSRHDAMDSHLAYHLLERFQRIKKDSVITDDDRHDLQTFIEQAVGPIQNRRPPVQL